eukprot:g58313.t1
MIDYKKAKLNARNRNAAAGGEDPITFDEPGDVWGRDKPPPSPNTMKAMMLGGVFIPMGVLGVWLAKNGFFN